MIGTTRININSFIRKYSSVLPMDLFLELNRLSLQGTRAWITTSTIIELDRRLAAKKAETKILNACAKRNTQGQKYEKAGKIGLAIKTYEQNISGDCYPAIHAFDRLMIIYRRQKDFDNEIRIINRAIEVLCPRYPDLLEKYQNRLEKAKALLTKNIENQTK